MKTPLNVALVGCGMVSGPHLAGWTASRRVNVVAVCDTNPSAARARATEFGIPGVFEDFERMVATVNPDIVDICTTLPSHKALTIAAAEAGCHVFLEKPMADSLETAREMINACRKAGVVLMVCQNFRWRSWAWKIKELIDGGAVGTPYYLSIVDRYPNTIPVGPSRIVPVLQNQPHYRAPQRLVGFEMAIHHIDIARWWTGEPEQVFARMLNISPHVGGDDVCTILLSRSDFVGVIEESWASPMRALQRIIIEGDRGSIVWDGRTMEISTPDDLSTPRVENVGPDISWQETFGLAQLHFLECLASKQTPMTSGEDNVKSLAIALAGYEADREHRSVSLFPS
ncbi:MAG: Gfo/Idh/MocA family oxidoreductase [Candidatus Latescibacteria bacterium]|nr:Gfo/Idh/MocA family oxidoreductase [Candidatus Latescibacterota bacterium]